LWGRQLLVTWKEPPLEPRSVPLQVQSLERSWKKTTPFVMGFITANIRMAVMRGRQAFIKVPILHIRFIIYAEFPMEHWWMIASEEDTFGNRNEIIRG
jgi:hypothetical protein